VAPIIVCQTQKTKPVFVGIEQEVMTKEFTARWMYADETNGLVKYCLVARNNRETEQDVATIPYHRVNLMLLKKRYHRLIRFPANVLNGKVLITRLHGLIDIR